MIHLPQALFAVIFALLCWGLGGVLFRRWLDDFPTPALRHVTAFALGCALYSYLTLFLGWLGLLDKLWMSALLLIGAAAMLVHGYREIAQKRLWPTIVAGDGAFLAVLGLFYLPAIVAALAPPVMREALTMHLALPKLYLQAQRIAYFGGYFYAAFPKGQEVLSVLMLDRAGDRAAQMLPVVQQLAATVGLYSLLAWRFDRFTAFVGGLGFAALPAAVVFAGGGYVEPAMNLALVAALTALAVIEPDDERTPALLIGLLGGWLLALKYSGGIFLLLLLFLLILRVRRINVREAISAVILCCLMTAPAVFWLISNWLVLGNPVFPYAYQWFGGVEWNGEMAVLFGRTLDSFGAGHTWSDMLLLPLRLAFSGRFDSPNFDGVLGPFVLLFLIAAAASPVWWRQRHKLQLLPGLGAVTVLALAFFAFHTHQMRFYLAPHLLVIVVAAVTIHRLVVAEHLRSIARPAMIALLILGLAYNAYVLVNETLRLGAYRPVFGLQTEEEFLAEHVPGYDAIRFINEQTHPEARVLCVKTGNFGYYFDRAFFAESFMDERVFLNYLDNSDSAEYLARSLLVDGFTHLLVNQHFIEHELSDAQTELWRSFLDQRGRIVFNGEGFAVIEVLTANRSGQESTVEYSAG